MDTERSLLLAILDEPEDDLRREMYCDFLEETGDPAKVNRAEQIRWGLANPKCSWVCLCKRDGRDGVYVERTCSVCDNLPDLCCIPTRGWADSTAPAFTTWGPDGTPTTDSRVYCNRETHFVARRGFVEEIRVSHHEFNSIMFAVHPITQVVIIDREPFEYESNRFMWEHYTPGGVGLHHVLRSGLFDRLKGYVRNDGYVAEYESSEAAKIALSDAAVACGRYRAKLGNGVPASMWANM